MLWRTADSGLAHSAVARDDATMAAIDARGPVRWIVVPSGHHRLDAPRFKARYPDAQVVAMPASQARVAQRVAVDGDYGRLPAGGAVTFEPLAGVPAEAVFIHRADDATETLIFNDGFMNLPARLPGVKGWVVKLIGSTGGPGHLDRAHLSEGPPTPRSCAAGRARAGPHHPGHGAMITDAAAVLSRPRPIPCTP
jgi:hypothetical protein